MKHFPIPNQPRQCAILIGGLGTRLGSLTGDLPKPLVAVAGQPFIFYVMAELARSGLTRFLLLAGHRAQAVEDLFSGTGWQQALPLEVKVEVSVEKEPLGTGGALKAVGERLDKTFLLANGDSFFRCAIEQLLRPFQQQSTLARLALRRVAARHRYGSVLLEGDRVTGFRERAAPSAAGLINAGLYYMRREILAHIPEGKSSLEAALFPMLAKAGQLEGLDLGDGYFIDIGIPEDLERARREFPRALDDKAWP